MPHFKEDSCYAASGKYCACIEFHLSEDKRRGFHTSQLIDYTLEPNPDGVHLDTVLSFGAKVHPSGGYGELRPAHKGYAGLLLTRTVRSV